MPHHTASAESTGTAATRLAVRLLDAWSARSRAEPAGAELPSDPGVPVLAALLYATGDPEAERSAARAVAVWARDAGRGPAHCGLYDGGLAGTLVGLRLGAGVHPGLTPVADRLRDHLVRTAPTLGHRREQVAFPDYDLIVGPSGTLLALTAGTSPTPAQLGPFADHLTGLCDADALPRLRTGQYAGHPNLGWLDGRINTGTGHGVAGVVTALTAALRRLGPAPGPASGLAPALGRATRWLVRQSFDDARSIRTWDGAGLDDAPPPGGARARQAWCYGTPGVSWALWDAADALGDRETADWAAAAFTSLAERYDERFHLFGDRPSDLLALCHGASGVLAVADAFARHAALPAAAALRARLLTHLRTRLPEVAALGATGMGLLGGAAGPLCALLTADHDAARTWLPCLGLR
ncbi:lanthionine synthetase LanC family protein [Kitasatospora sp. NPDC096077]|uniref:lanthionine synthetase LanC family protein n=1 Tax=Kitasatospora sp. NPDC096077 TaxID=3155544 RepID=UPI0033179393